MTAALVLISSSGWAAPRAGSAPVARQGVMDLRSWDFARDGLVQLDGEWEFFWSRLLSGAEKEPDGGFKPDGYLRIPGTWNGQRTLDGKKIGGFGYATFRLKLLLPVNAGGMRENLVISMKEAKTSYAVYCLDPGSGDVRRVAAGGTVGASAGTAVPSYRSSRGTLPRAGEMVLYLQASNFSHSRGGPTVAPLLGTAGMIESDTLKNNITDFFLIGIIFIFGLYHLMLFLLRRTDRSPLWFGLFCLLIAARTVVTGRYVEALFPGLNAFDALVRIEYFTFYMGMAIFAAFLNDFFPRLFHRTFFIAMMATGILLSASLAAPPFYFTGILALSQAVAGIAFLYAVVRLPVLGVREKNLAAWIALAGCVAFFMGVLNDILANQRLIESPILSHYGLAGFIFCHSVNIAYANATARATAEYLSKNLAIEVDRKTTELRKSNEELQSANEEMTVINQALVETRDQLWGEMELAKKIQTVLLPDQPLVRGYEISAYMKPATEVGGDYYDIINVGNMDWVVIGDVSGHGVPAGLIMMMVQTSIHSVLETKPDAKPSELLVLVNGVLYRNIRKLGEDKYMTITVLSCIKDGRFYYSGLHQDIILYRAKKGAVEIVETDGMWIGILDDLNGRVGDSMLSLGIGDTMLVFTDGITEAWKRGSVKNARDPAVDLFGQQRLVDILLRTGSARPREIKAAILESLSGYECKDDVTLVVLRRLE